MREQLIHELNASHSSKRIQALESLVKYDDQDDITDTDGIGYVNNHIHTSYSFSPYSPTKAVWMARKAGLLTAGIVDHDAIGGAKEFIKAGKLLRMPTTIGIECRVDMKQTPFFGKRLNNTDQKGIAYVAMHGIPHTQIDEIESFLAPYRMNRNIRNREMVNKMNDLFKEKIIDFDQDVAPLSMDQEGGSITERHLLYALSLKLMDLYGKGEDLIHALNLECHITLKGKALDYMKDTENPYYAYDLLGILKGHFVSQFYIEATKECPDVKDFVAKAKAVGAIPAYAYLGDVQNSVTGDKRDDAFEDAYLDELVVYLKEIGFTAITYMPSRNTGLQLERIRNLCVSNGFFEISGEDINSPRQSFLCEALMKPEFSHLTKATWALIGHEIAATNDATEGLFSPQMIEKLPELSQRIDYYEKVGKDFILNGGIK